MLVSPIEQIQIMYISYEREFNDTVTKKSQSTNAIMLGSRGMWQKENEK